MVLTSCPASKSNPPPPLSHIDVESPRPRLSCLPSLSFCLRLPGVRHCVAGPLFPGGSPPPTHSHHAARRAARRTPRPRLDRRRRGSNRDSDIVSSCVPPSLRGGKLTMLLVPESHGKKMGRTVKTMVCLALKIIFIQIFFYIKNIHRYQFDVFN